MEAIVRAAIPGATIAAVIANKAEAAGLAFARAHGIAAEVVCHTDYPTRDDFDAALAASIDRHAPDLLVLAGFMRVLGDAFVRRYEGRLINIHPSLLPSFPGLHTHRKAIEAGVKLHGATVHFVTPMLDCGPIIAQAAVVVSGEDTETSLAARVLELEHVTYPQAVRWFVEDRLEVNGNRVRLRGASVQDSGWIVPLPEA